jgi:hypothetical protein
MAAELTYQTVEVHFNDALLKDPSRLINEIARRRLTELAVKVSLWIYRNSPHDLDEFRRGLIVRVEEFGVDVLAAVRATAPHSYFVEHGRPAGKDPPVNILLAWVQRHFADAQNFNILARHRQLTRAARIRRTGRGAGRTFTLHDFRRQFAEGSPARMKLSALERQHKQIQFWLGRKIGAFGQPGFHLFEQSLIVNRQEIEITGQLIGHDLVTMLWA